MDYELYDVMEYIEDGLSLGNAYIESNYEIGIMYAEINGKRYRISIDEMCDI